MPQNLSDKAKGKQRADAPVPLPPTTRALVVRFTDGVPDLELRLGAADSMRELKHHIRTARPQLERRRLKLIHAGRLVTGDMLLFDWLLTLDDRQRRAAAPPPEAGVSSSSAGQLEHDDTSDTAPAAHPAVLPTAYFHCSVGAEMHADEEDGDDDGQMTQIKPLRGFDRLAGAGFSEADIANFRRQFHAGAADSLALAEFTTEEEYEEHARTLEEQWIESIDGGGLGGRAADNAAVLQGVLLGFFMPVIPFFFFTAPKLPVFWSTGAAVESLGSVIFSRRMQMGLVVGFMINVLLGLWRYLWESL